MSDQEQKKGSKLFDSSKEDEPKQDKLKDEDLNQVSGGFSMVDVATCGKCLQPLDKCTCTNAL